MPRLDGQLTINERSFCSRHMLQSVYYHLGDISKMTIIINGVFKLLTVMYSLSLSDKYMFHYLNKYDTVQ